VVLKLIYSLKKLLENWSKPDVLNIYEIASLVDMPVPFIWENFCEVGSKEYGARDPLNRDEVACLVGLLVARAQPDIRKKKQDLEVKKLEALRAYRVLKERVCLLQKDQKWYQAYRTLVYYLGLHEFYLPETLLLEVFSECLRLGFKSDANLQELYNWLDKAIKQASVLVSHSCIQETLDLVDAYIDDFIHRDLPRATTYFQKILQDLEDKSPLHSNLVEKISPYPMLGCA